MVSESGITLRMVAGLMVGLCCLLGVQAASAAEITARLDRSTIVAGETVTLVIQTNDAEQSLEADLRVLEADFELLDRRSETQMSIVNGRQTSVVRLLLTLEPRRTGTLRVPSLSFPGAVTDALTLTVQPAPELAPGEMPPVFIEVSLDPAEGPYYVHAQFSLTVKIFYQQNLTEASINPPTPEQASVRLLDEVPYPAERNGTRYRVLQRSYAVFPERSGTLVIPPLRLTGRLIERSGSRLWQPNVRGRRITEESEPLTIEIEPKPGGYQGTYWLPARQVTLSQQVSDADALRVGEPVTRTVIIDAVGLEENMLEEPPWPDLPDARMYPDQPQGISRDDGQWVRGHKEFRYAIVPEEPGTLVLPELRLDWWDTVNNQARTAVLPELEVAVAPLQLVPETRPDLTADGVAPANSPGQEGRTPAAQTAFWKMLSLVLGLLWLGTLWWSLTRRHPARVNSERAATLPAEEADLMKALRLSCRRHEAGETRRLLRQWLKMFGPPAAHGSISELAEVVEEPALRDALLAFEAHGYRPAGGEGWSGTALWEAFSSWQGRQAKNGSEDALAAPDLYARAR